MEIAQYCPLPTGEGSDNDKNPGIEKYSTEPDQIYARTYVNIR